MTITDFLGSIDYLTKAELTPFIWGNAGIGKSSIVKQYADKMGYKFFPFYLGTQSDLGDILGLAEFHTDENGNKTTVFATPKWMQDMITYCNENPDSGAVIFLDEFNRARRDILSGMFSLALDKSSHTIKLPKNCHIVAAGNPPTEDYVVTDVDETALMARFVHIKLEPSIDEWVKFAKETKVEPTIIDFIRQQPELLEDTRQQFNLPVKADRRAWSRLNKLFALKTPDHLMDQLMPGIVGLERTVAYKQFMKDQDKPLTGKEILSGMKPELLDKWCNPEDISGAILDVTCDNMFAELKERESANNNLTDAEKDNLMRFFEKVPKDKSYKFIKQLVNEESKIFQDFYAKDDYEDKCLSIVRVAKGEEEKKAQEAKEEPKKAKKGKK